jgi:hypothetical protein
VLARDEIVDYAPFRVGKICHVCMLAGISQART